MSEKHPQFLRRGDFLRLREKFWHIDEMHVARYSYSFSAVADGASSDYGSNKIDSLIPGAGMMHHVVPAVVPFLKSGQTVALRATAHVSCVVRLAYPGGKNKRWSMAKLTDAGYVDHITSPPDEPNQNYEFFVTDDAAAGDIQLRAENSSGQSITQEVIFEVGVYKVSEWKGEAPKYYRDISWVGADANIPPRA